MFTHHDIHSRLTQLASQLTELQTCCDPDFDSFEELDREFAELRMFATE